MLLWFIMIIYKYKYKVRLVSLYVGLTSVCVLYSFVFL